jgi:hypothetical protein
VLHFFGLAPENREDLLEEIFFIMKSMNISYEALREMPVSYRRWFVNRLIKSINDSRPKDQYGVDSDTPLSSVMRNR